MYLPDKNKNIQWLLKPEFHGSRITGPNSVPVFWRHSEKQILLDLKEAGFSKAYLKSFCWNKSKELNLACKQEGVDFTSCFYSKIGCKPFFRTAHYLAESSISLLEKGTGVKPSLHAGGGGFHKRPLLW